MLIHASCVSWQNKGILLIGDSGSGKSTGALALLEKGASLIADDYVEISIQNNAVLATCPKTIKGKIEVRGLGIIDIKSLSQTTIDVVIDCKADFASVPRMPDIKTQKFFDKEIPLYALCPFENIFAQKVLLILASL